MDTTSQSTSIPSAEEQKPANSQRRRLLKTLAATGGATVASTLLPGKWIKPIIETGVLPAHAVTSVIGTLEVVARWDDDVNLNLAVEEPDLTLVEPSNLVGPSLRHDGDTIFEEAVSNRIPGFICAGTYRVFLQWPATTQLQGDPQPNAVVTITTNTESQSIGPITDLAIGDSRLIAQVTFPAGNIFLL